MVKDLDDEEAKRYIKYHNFLSALLYKLGENIDEEAETRCN
jgi:hypothetical protein